MTSWKVKISIIDRCFQKLFLIILTILLFDYYFYIFIIYLLLSCYIYMFLYEAEEMEFDQIPFNLLPLFHFF